MFGTVEKAVTYRKGITGMRGLLTGACLALGFCSPVLQAESAPASAQKVIIEGIEGGPADNVRSHLRLAAEPCDAPAWRLRRLWADPPGQTPAQDRAR